mmetsp:Transcript_22661/g.89655  ORF Transcript_22661/g.89655 Transcript_22661/m.89655 type:complete len:1045 (+) Transcript_22661:264-3398(+)|eukprot:CAMPEP_0114608540 /NCGR_PEP_ID=MMETSP0168-20121206/2631_1 /TAXON_ID=95228 ORGANISM="Vannella sp., Strain DIVA3 517/6/12" /NCGR_SAMPLE_ID=MMETSP0168 /ASSEMBLY_ACC=CAM_ASM_000044 /LENGTH=1044 /DNA_ID=CAMNT_0001819441 /DNA_START=209 /DNA_END=3343 /DNA_ORIENTATION=+
MSGDKDSSEGEVAEATHVADKKGENGVVKETASTAGDAASEEHAALRKTAECTGERGTSTPADQQKVAQKVLRPPVPDTEAEAKAEEKAAEEKPASKVTGVAAARAAMLRGGGRAGGGGGGGGRPPLTKGGETDVRKRALASHQMMQAWGKKKRGPRAENQFLKIERNEAEAYALDISMRMYMDLVRELDGGGDIARCSISAQETRQLRAVVMDILENNLDSIMKEFCIEVPDPNHGKKQEEEKLVAQAETATAELEKEEARERDWESKKVADASTPESDGKEQARAMPDDKAELASSADDDSKSAKDEAEAGSAADKAEDAERSTGEDVKPDSSAEAKTKSCAEEPSASDDASVKKPNDQQDSAKEDSVQETAASEETKRKASNEEDVEEDEEDKEKEETDKEKGAAEDGDKAKEDSGPSDEDSTKSSEDSEPSEKKKKRKSKKRKSSRKGRKKKDEIEDGGDRKKGRVASRALSTNDVGKVSAADSITEDTSEASKESKGHKKRKKKDKEKAKSADEAPLRASRDDAATRKKKRSRRLSTSAIASVFVNSSDDKAKASRKEKKDREKKEKREDVASAAAAASASASAAGASTAEPDAAQAAPLQKAPTEAADAKRKHRFPGAGPLGRLLKKTNSRLENSVPPEDDKGKETKKGRGRDRRKDTKKDSKKGEDADADSPAKKGTFQRPTLTKDGSGRGRNRQRSAAGRPMLTRGGTGAKMSGPVVPMITLKRNMVDVEKLNSILKEAISESFGSPTLPASNKCPHDDGELDFYFLSLQGPRAANEDEYCVVEHVNEYFDLPEGTPNYSFFGVYDGHSGKFGSVYTRSQLISQIFRHPDFHTEPDKAFVDAFTLTDKLINDIEERENFDCGTTAISCCIRDHKEMLISNVGDCEGFTCRAGQPVRMAVAHRPSDEDEKARIKALGGAVVWFGTWRVNGMLAVSRSLGDNSVKNLVIATPDTSRLEVTDEDEFLVCASDGIWDVLDFPGAIEIVYNTLREGKGRKACCNEICQEALRRGTKDNVTVVVIFFQKEVGGISFEDQVKC